MCPRLKELQFSSGDLIAVLLGVYIIRDGGKHWTGLKKSF